MFHSANSSLYGKIAAIVCKSDDMFNELYFKFYDHSIHQAGPPPAYPTTSNDGCSSDESNWQYIKCNELMGSKKTIKWEGSNPALLEESLVGMKVRRPFKVDKEWIWFNGEVIQYLKSNKEYEVRYEDGDVRKEEKTTVVKYLMYTF